ncbi:MAG: ABC transporter six-transmembrane domain-containing protein [Gemmatimonadota bacterium]|uniref:ABC transporter six-transmembrane domain-containing protein n=1 Tax=Candidatus Palauibacter scopulicola TaxID=3056741 RepID=UPI0023A5C358|nr:ABC transporter six-transmembrane domain-containing protein [Candidatus Palauibacter scopulicola]MDE2664180.1 ABC transporter six-transmembrane domain-containing protein [Candidatus Palauibacter scopulicola]
MDVLLKRFAGRLTLTLSLVVLESAGWLLFPLVIGRAIDGVLAGSTRGLYELAGLGIGTIFIAIGRRVVDSRAYAGIYVRLGEEMVASTAERSTSTRTARLGMLREIVEFFEHSLPQLITSAIGLAGTVVILSTLNVPVFLGCLAVAVATGILYALTGKLTTRYNEGLNDEHERQVDAVDSGDPVRLGEHLRAMTRWNIRLSDLEAGTFGINWVLMMGLLVFAVGISAERTVEYGAVFAIVMYVFQFVESLMALPFYYQQWLRLREISGRLARVGAEAGTEAGATP